MNEFIGFTESETNDIIQYYYDINRKEKFNELLNYSKIHILEKIPHPMQINT